MINDAAGGHFELFTANPSPAVNAHRTRQAARAGRGGAAAPAGFPDAHFIGWAPRRNLARRSHLRAGTHTPKCEPAQCRGQRLLPDKDIQARLAKLDNVVSPGSVEQFTAQIRREHEANARVVKEAGIKLD